MSKLFASSLLLAVASSAVEPAPAIPFTDGEYALKAAVLAGQTCSASCNVIHHAGRFSTKGKLPCTGTIDDDFMLDIVL